MSRLGKKNLVPSPRALAKAKGERLTASGHCYGCAKENTARMQAVGGSQHERARGYRKRYCKDNAKELSEKAKIYRASLPEEKRVAQEAKRKSSYAKWRADFPERHCAKEGRRRATKLRATPDWGIAFFIEEAYALAKLREQVVGGKWHVDHIVPLKSKIVCGLHVEHNLRVIPAQHNLAKSNKHWPDMPV